MEKSLLIAVFQYYFQTGNLNISDIRKCFLVNSNLAKELVAELNKFINSGRKYRYTGYSIQKNGHTLGQIQALRDLDNVKAGDLGGFIESDQNLRHENNCWVADQAMVFAGAMVWDNASIKNTAVVEGNVWVYDNAQVCGKAELVAYGKGEIWISGQTEISNQTRINIYDFDSEELKNLYVFNDKAIFSNTVISNYIFNGRDWEKKELTDYLELKKNLERQKKMRPVWV